MLLRRITLHVKEQNWTAIAIDFVIVVVGVFIGIQVSNWNEARGFKQREIRLLKELRSEVALNAKRNRILAEGLEIGADSARRVLSVAQSDDPACSDDCWSLFVDLMHASQWVRPLDSWSAYEELRRAGLPSEREIIEKVERFRDIGRRGGDALLTPPEYRAEVRRLLPIDLQVAYWTHCWGQGEYGETYSSPCARPANIGPMPPSLLEVVIRDEALMMSLTEWTSIAFATSNGLLMDLQAAAGIAIESIDRVIAEARR